ncbi:MAG: acetate--CoA ligase, partial [Elusimicrobia bacterium RIFCSPLOWO2_01_FULL_60_11]
MREKIIPPHKDFTRQANMNSKSIYAQAAKDPQKFWAEQAKNLVWSKPWKKVLEWKAPHAKWFTGGKLNASVNCLDRFLGTPTQNKAAIIWEGEPGDSRTLTYRQLHAEVCKFANVLKGLGVKKGDRVIVYMPMVPELAVTLLSCARIGAVHSVVFGGFSSEALKDRINDAQAKVVVTASGGVRRGSVIQLKKNVDGALDACPSVEKVVVVNRAMDPMHVPLKEGRDLWWHRLMDEASPQCPAEPMDSEDMLFTLYTSGTTGKPKGIVHTTAGYLLGVNLTTRWIFDLKPEDIFWCTADIGWVTGHSYIVYGPLSNGATVVMYEGSPDTPDKDRFWRIIEKYGVTVFYTAPTAIRTFMKWGESYPKRCDLSSLRLLGSVGEPINPEAWMWYHKNIGRENCPVVDTWWQTETGSILISPLPGITPLKPGSATWPFPGISAEILDEKGKPAPTGAAGYLVLTSPWPSMMRGIYNDPERYKAQYWSKFPGKYFTGDGAKKDKDGCFWLLGRIDDVMNVSGHRISTMEVESALVDHHAVAEAAVVGKAHDIKGQAIAAFVTLKDSFKGKDGNEEMAGLLKKHVSEKI